MMFTNAGDHKHSSCNADILVCRGEDLSAVSTLVGQQKPTLSPKSSSGEIHTEYDSSLLAGTAQSI